MNYMDRDPTGSIARYLASKEEMLRFHVKNAISEWYELNKGFWSLLTGGEAPGNRLNRDLFD